MIEKCSKNNTPSIDWVNDFIKCNNLSNRVSEHIKHVPSQSYNKNDDGNIAPEMDKTLAELL